MRNKNIEEIIEFVKNLNPIFDTKKDIYKVLSMSYGTSITYDQFKGYYRRHKELEDLLNSKIKKQSVASNMKLNVNFPSDAISDAIKSIGETLATDFTNAFSKLDLNKINSYIDETNNYPKFNGLNAESQSIDPEVVYEQMLAHFEEERAVAEIKRKQTIHFNHGPICIVNMSCIHFGGAMDIKQVFDDVDLIKETPNTYINLLGDLTDNFVIPYFHKLSLNRKFTIEEEQAIKLHFLEEIVPHLLSVTSGNHDQWSEAQIGYDLLKNNLVALQAEAFYDKNENVFDINVDGMPIKFKIRHQWQGNSLYNPTHGIERGMRADPDIKIGIGGHIHRGSLIREFIYNGERKIAMLCGTYKYYDEYARQEGFENHDSSSANAIIIDPNSKYGYMTFNNVQDACNIMSLIT